MGKKRNDQISTKKKNLTTENLLADLAIERTELALRRIQLAWVHTLIALIATGFAIDKAAEAFHDARIASGEAWVKNGHALAFVLTLSGTALLIPVTFFYAKRANELAHLRDKRSTHFSLVLLLSYLVISVGILLLYFMGTSDEF